MWVIQEFVLAQSEPLFLFLGGYKALKDSDLRDAAWEIFQMESIPLTIPERTTILSVEYHADHIISE